MPPGPGCPLHLSALPTLTLRPNYRTFADHSAHINIHKAEDAGAASHKAASLEDTAAVSRQQAAGEQRVLRVRKVLPWSCHQQDGPQLSGTPGVAEGALVGAEWVVWKNKLRKSPRRPSNKGQRL